MLSSEGDATDAIVTAALMALGSRRSVAMRQQPVVSNDAGSAIPAPITKDIFENTRPVSTALPATGSLTAGVPRVLTGLQLIPDRLETRQLALRETLLFGAVHVPVTRHAARRRASSCHRDYRVTPLSLKFDGPFTTLPGSARKPKLKGEFAAMSRL